MWDTFKRFLSSVSALAGRLAGSLGLRPRGRWVEGSHTESHRRFWFFSPPHAKRNYCLYLPGRYAAAQSWPLLVMLHGCKQDPITYASGTRMNQIADQEGFLVLYPEQRRLANAYRCWNWFDRAALRAGGEAALIAGMVREVIAGYGVDPERVYIAGLSAGGAMTSILASCYGRIFAACAVHSGLMYGAAESVSQATMAMKNGSRASTESTAQQAVAQPDFTFVPAIVLHGSADETVHPANAEQVIDQFLAMFRLAGDGDRAVTQATRNESGAGRYPYEVSEYRCGDTLVLRKVLVEGLAHAWSGGNGAHPFNDPGGPDASRMIWEFLKNFRRNAGKPAVAG